MSSTHLFCSLTLLQHLNALSSSKAICLTMKVFERTWAESHPQKWPFVCFRAGGRLLLQMMCRIEFKINCDSCQQINCCFRSRYTSKALQPRAGSAIWENWVSRRRNEFLLRAERLVGRRRERDSISVRRSLQLRGKGGAGKGAAQIKHLWSGRLTWEKPFLAILGWKRESLTNLWWTHRLTHTTALGLTLNLSAP